MNNETTQVQRATADRTINNAVVDVTDADIVKGLSDCGDFVLSAEQIRNGYSADVAADATWRTVLDSCGLGVEAALVTEAC